MSAHADDEIIRVAELFAHVARDLAADEDLDKTLHMIVNLAVENLHGCEFAGITLVERKAFSSPASSNEVPRIVDRIQEEVGEGPCIDAITEHEVFQTGDLASEARWPKFSRRAYEEAGIQSVLSFRLFVEEDTMGALNLYSTAKDAFADDTDIALASVFAAHAGVAMSGARRIERLQRKAENRDVIGRAKGILMARSDASDEEAFDMLRRASQRLNIKVVDVAERVAHSTDTPTN